MTNSNYSERQVSIFSGRNALYGIHCFSEKEYMLFFSWEMRHKHRVEYTSLQRQYGSEKIWRNDLIDGFRVLSMKT